MLLEAHFFDAVRDENGQVHFQGHFAGRVCIVGGVERAFVELKRHRLASAGIPKIYDKSWRGQVGESKRLCWKTCLVSGCALLWDRWGPLRSPSQASQLLHRPHRPQGQG